MIDAAVATAGPDPAWLFDAAPSGHLVLDTEGRVLLANATFLQWTGHDAGSIGGRRFDGLLTLAGRLFFESRVAPLLVLHRAVDAVALDLRRRDGSTLATLANFVVRPGGGGTARILVAVFDASERRSHERALLEARRAAEAATRAKDEILHMLGHDIRDGLSTIALATELLAGAEDPDRRSRYLAILRAATTKLTDLTGGILEAGSARAGAVVLAPVPVELASWLRELADLHRIRAEAKGLRLDVVIDGIVPDTLAIDPVRLGQILGNLLSNALKFTERGRVVLAAGLGHDGAGPNLVLRVADEGPGIAADQQTDIFLPFRRADATRARHTGGTGLGLSICRDLVALMGGSIGVESAPGHGATFTVRIPVHAG